MSTIEERTAERERQIAAALEGQRRMAHPEDYVYDKAQNRYWDTVNGTLHGADEVDASIPQVRWRVVQEEGDPEPLPGETRPRGRPRQRRERLIPPSKDIMRVECDQFVEGSTWWPGSPQLIKDWYVDGDGFRPSKGARFYNTYRPAPVIEADPKDARPWINHICKLFPGEGEADAFFDFAAQMVQRPECKPNHGVLIAGAQGIGKDAALVPLKAAIGAWNARDITPDDVFEPFKPWLETVLLIVNEVRPSNDDARAHAMYNILKPLTAAPPETLPLNDKYVKLRHIRNVLRVIVTTNHPSHFRLERDDRRWLVLESPLQPRWPEAEGDSDYFKNYFAWLEDGGADAVAAWLRSRDVSRWDPKAAPMRTPAWHRVVDSWTEDDDAISRALERLPNEVHEDGRQSSESGRPPLFFGQEILDASFDDKEEITKLMTSTRRRGHRFDELGYEVFKARWMGSDGRFTARQGEHQYRSRVCFVDKTQKQALGEGCIKALIESRIKGLATQLAQRSR
jgi:hypothetical protein